MRTRVRVVWSAWAVVVGLGAGLLALAFLNGPHLPGTADRVLFWMIALTSAAYATVGAVILARRGNRIGWIFVAVGFITAFGFFSEQYAFRAAVLAPGTLPGAVPMAVMGTLVWPWTAVLGLLFLLFPDGRLPSPRWRPVAWALPVGAVMVAIGFGLRPGPLNGIWNDRGVLIENPIGVPLEGLLTPLWYGGVALALAASLASVAAMILRFRRTTGEERQQIKWPVYVAATAAALFLAMTLMGSLGAAATDSAVGDALWMAFFTTLVVGIPAAMTIAILKHRLYDIDVVINKTLVYGSLAAFITAVYVGVVVGIGNAVGTRGEPNLGLQVAATALVAVAFQPVRERIQRLANRLVYGERATPYEVMAGFAARMAGSLEVDEVLPRMAEAAARGVGAARARVRVVLARGGEREATWPPGASGGGFDRALPVAHRGEEVGEIAVAKAPGDPLRPQEESLLGDLAGQAGLALHNVRLTEELRARVAEIGERAEAIRDSQRRILTAGADERRRIERALEDRADGKLKAIAGGLERALEGLDRDPAATAARLEALQGEAQGALEEVRDLARGIFPPLLADRGLAAALDAQLRKIPIPVRMEAAAGVEEARYPGEVEAAVYFCSLEALRNAARHSGSTQALLRLQETDGDVSFTVSDDGRGFDAETPGSGLRHVRDRVEALGGTLEVRSAPGDGTTVTGRIPAMAREAVG